MPLMNSHIVEECLPFTSLRLDPEDINLSMGAGYVPDAEIPVSYTHLTLPTN